MLRLPAGWRLRRRGMRPPRLRGRETPLAWHEHQREGFVQGARTFSTIYKVMVAFNEGFYPVAGDKAVVITRRIKNGMFEAAKAYLENSMIASLAADSYRRYYIVLEQESADTLIAFSLLRGEAVSDPKVVAVRETGFSRFMAQPFEMKTYTFFAVIEE